MRHGRPTDGVEAGSQQADSLLAPDLDVWQMCAMHCQPHIVIRGLQAVRHHASASGRPTNLHHHQRSPPVQTPSLLLHNTACGRMSYISQRMTVTPAVCRGMKGARARSWAGGRDSAADRASTARVHPTHPPKHSPWKRNWKWKCRWFGYRQGRPGRVGDTCAGIPAPPPHAQTELGWARAPADTTTPRRTQQPGGNSCGLRWLREVIAGREVTRMRQPL